MKKSKQIKRKYVHTVVNAAEGGGFLLDKFFQFLYFIKLFNYLVNPVLGLYLNECCNRLILYFIIHSYLEDRKF